VRADATVKEALAILQSMDIRHLPVVSERDELIGMVSDRDLRGVSIPRLIDERWFGDLRVAMQEKIIDVTEIIELMLEHKVGALPVIDGDRGLVGIVSYMDVLRELAVLVEDAAQ
jgi:CBS domain-containing protein